MYWNKSGYLNAALGEEALASNISGESNTASGYRALQANNTGNNNIAFGSYALNTNITGSNNTAIGTTSDVTSSDLTNATAIGYGARVAVSNTIQLGNNSITDVKTSGSITAGSITIPNTDGTNGQVLATDGAGILAWTTKTGITSDQANQLSAAMTALNCIAALAPPGADDEEEEHGDEDHGDDSSYPEFWIYTQSCIKDAFAGI